MTDKELEEFRYNKRVGKSRPKKARRDTSLGIMPGKKAGYEPLSGRVTPVGDMDFNFRNYVR